MEHLNKKEEICRKVAGELSVCRENYKDESLWQRSYQRYVYADL